MDRAPARPQPTVRDSAADEQLVRRFLADVRAGDRVQLAGRYLAPRVLAHQGRPGAVTSVVVRTPGEYADHVLQMLAAFGPWRFDVLTVRRLGELIDATWRQTGTVNAEGPSRGRRIVEHGHAAYLVAGGRITQYWIESRHEILREHVPSPCPNRVPGATVCNADGPTARAQHGDDVGRVLRYTAFSTQPHGGNPAGVVLDATGMTAADMLAVAADVGFSETAFLTPDGERFRTRYFSPLAEVSFCGHATIAAAVARAERVGPGRLVLDTMAGPVEVVTGRDADGRWQATLTSVVPTTVDLADGDRRALLDALGWHDGDLDTGLPPRVAYAGAWHPVLAVRTRERLAALDYDMAALTDLMAARGWTTVDLVWRQAETRFHARNPFPPGGVVEDPATGAAAAALGGYLREGGHVRLPSVVTVLQGADMGRPSVLTVDIPTDPTEGVRVTGHAVALPPPL